MIIIISTIIAFVFGGILGIAIMALMNVASRESRLEEDAECRINTGEE